MLSLGFTSQNLLSMSQRAWSGYASPTIFSKSSQFIKSTSSSKSNRLPCLRKKISKRTWCISNTHTLSWYHYLQKKICLMFCPVLSQKQELRFSMPNHNSRSKQHTAIWETHTTQLIPKSCFLRWKDYGLDGSILQVRPALSLTAEPCLHKQTEKLLNMVAKSLLAASVQEETWSQKCSARSLSFLTENKWNL